MGQSLIYKCGNCVHLPKCAKKGKLKTSLACNSWELNIETLDEKLKEIRVLLSKLEGKHLKMFYEHWEDAVIPEGFTLERFCMDCCRFQSCKYDPQKYDRPEYFSCILWNFDLSKAAKDPRCPEDLKKLIYLTKGLNSREYPLVHAMIQKQYRINDIRPVKVSLGDKVILKLPNDRWFKGWVYDLTEEHVVVKSRRGLVTLMLVYETLLSKDMWRPFVKVSDSYL